MTKEVVAWRILNFYQAWDSQVRECKEKLLIGAVRLRSVFAQQIVQKSNFCD